MLSLRNKIIFAFSVIIITGTSVMVAFVNFSTRAGYRDFAHNNDVVYSQKLKPLIEEYYKENQTFKGVEDLIKAPRGRMGDMMMMGKGRNAFPPVAITDENGKVQASNFKLEKNKLTKKELTKGIRILYDSEVAGYILTGTMIVSKLTDEEEHYLDRTITIIIVTSAFILIISIIFSILFSMRLTRPVTTLSSAASKIKSGDYSARVDITGSDEISELGKSFNSMAQSIEDSDKWRKQIIADSAHELRTPVTLIQGTTGDDSGWCL